MVYPVSHSQVDISTEPKQPCHRPGLTCRAGTVKGGCALLLPDDPPAIQELMNDLYGFTLLQGYFIVHCSSVGSDGDVGLSWSTAGEGARYESLPSMRFANSPVLSGPGASSSWSFLVSFCRLLQAICGAPGVLPSTHSTQGNIPTLNHRHSHQGSGTPMTAEALSGT